ncbi:hypothetical protein CLV99_0742 [Sphingobacterium yanglingense]|uniref:Uncharacterized protein n=1 Tax=Sphingobacterium yanglingense TaxID=1437280 RepID=A0A4R6WK58_9SPHI|nr:hypothetical protein CLV99_0742 [Sphingobacterium yanglingense]
MSFETLLSTNPANAHNTAWRSCSYIGRLSKTRTDRTSYPKNRQPDNNVQDFYTGLCGNSGSAGEPYIYAPNPYRYTVYPSRYTTHSYSYAVYLYRYAAQPYRYAAQPYRYATLPYGYAVCPYSYAT